MGQYLGLSPLEQPTTLGVLAKSGSGPVALDAPPTYRIYGPAGVMQNGTGAAALRDAGPVAGASGGAPIVVTAPGHGLSTGTRVTVVGVAGNTAANGSWTVTVLDGNTFSLDGSAANGPYAGGGLFSVTGLYQVAFTPQAANGFVAGQTYSVLWSGAIVGAPWAEMSTFTVV